MTDAHPCLRPGAPGRDQESRGVHPRAGDIASTLCAGVADEGARSDTSGMSAAPARANAAAARPVRAQPASARSQPAAGACAISAGYHGQTGGRKAQRHRPARWRRGAGRGGRISSDDWLSWHGACVRGAIILARWQAPGAGLPDGPALALARARMAIGEGRCPRRAARRMLNHDAGR